MQHEPIVAVCLQVLALATVPVNSQINPAEAIPAATDAATGFTFAAARPPLPVIRADPAALADASLDGWKQRLAATAASVPAYPSAAYSNRGIVLTAGRRTYFTAAYVTLRVLREHLGTQLPIEVFYAGAAELPEEAVRYLETAWPNVRVVDMTTLPGLEDVNLKGYQIKAAALYHSSFREVLWLDSDNMPLRDPADLFDTVLYKQHGALLWPDVCNMVSLRSETFSVFGQTAPRPYPEPRPGKRTIWPEKCFPNVPQEVETGQILIDKERAWRPLYMAYYININHGFFLQRLFHGDKMTFHFAFVAAKQEYGLVPFQPASVGVAAHSKISPKSKTSFCGNTLAQKFPDEDTIFFLHRSSAKFKDAGSYFIDDTPPSKVWRHVATANPGNSWNLVFRGEMEEKFFAGSDSSAHHECLRPTRAKLAHAPTEVRALESTALGYLRDLRDLPFYPGYRHCNDQNRFFCRTP